MRHNIERWSPAACWAPEHSRYSCSSTHLDAASTKPLSMEAARAAAITAQITLPVPACSRSCSAAAAAAEESSIRQISARHSVHETSLQRHASLQFDYCPFAQAGTAAAPRGIPRRRTNCGSCPASPAVRLDPSDSYAACLAAAPRPRPGIGEAYQPNEICAGGGGGKAGCRKRTAPETDQGPAYRTGAFWRQGGGGVRADGRPVALGERSRPAWRTWAEVAAAAAKPPPPQAAATVLGAGGGDAAAGAGGSRSHAITVASLTAGT